MKIIKYFESSILRQKVLNDVTANHLKNNKLFLGLGDNGKIYQGFQKDIFALRNYRIKNCSYFNLFWYQLDYNTALNVDIFVMKEIIEEFGNLLVFI